MIKTFKMDGGLFEAIPLGHLVVFRVIQRFTSDGFTVF